MKAPRIKLEWLAVFVDVCLALVTIIVIYGVIVLIQRAPW